MSSVSDCLVYRMFNGLMHVRSPAWCGHGYIDCFLSIHTYPCPDTITGENDQIGHFILPWFLHFAVACCCMLLCELLQGLLGVWEPAYCWRNTNPRLNMCDLVVIDVRTQWVCLYWWECLCANNVNDWSIYMCRSSVNSCQAAWHTELNLPSREN